MQRFCVCDLEYGRGTPSEHDPVLLDLLQSCGPGLIYHTQKERHQLLNTVWKKLHTAGMTVLAAIGIYLCNNSV